MDGAPKSRIRDVEAVAILAIALTPRRACRLTAGKVLPLPIAALATLWVRYEFLAQSCSVRASCAVMRPSLSACTILFSASIKCAPGDYGHGGPIAQPEQLGVEGPSVRKRTVSGPVFG